ncbi:MAG: glycosyltransferase [Phototrophicales bacterium]|nr:MAG: glycosyltransferase [Phototrophicales bacterium]
MELSLVIPVYNEVESLPHLYTKLVQQLEALGKTWEIIFVDDGSKDGSTEVLKRLQSEDSRITVAIQRRNFGKSLALAVGFELARGDVIITMDADLQDEPSEIPNLLAKIDEGYDLVVGWKKKRHDPLSKTIPSYIANRITRLLTGVQLHDMNSGLKAMQAEVARTIRIYGDLHRYIPIIAHYNGFAVTEIPVVHHQRQFGRSKYGPGRLLRGGFDLLTVVFVANYRYRPLHLFGGIGSLMTFLGLVINAYLTIEWFRGDRPIGDRPLLTLGVLLMIVGVQLLTIGLLAELLVSSIQQRANPLDTVRQVLSVSSAQKEFNRES